MRTLKRQLPGHYLGMRSGSGWTGQIPFTVKHVLSEAEGRHLAFGKEVFSGISGVMDEFLKGLWESEDSHMNGHPSLPADYP